MTTDIMPVVKIAETGEPMADSRDVAAFFGKNHKDVLRAIRELGCSAEFRQRNFAPFKVKDLTGESTSHVMMTKDGFTFLAMGFTGERAAIFKERYIAAFNAMAARPAVPDFSDPEVLQMHLLASTKREIELQNRIEVMRELSQAMLQFNEYSTNPRPLARRALDQQHNGVHLLCNCHPFGQQSAMVFLLRETFGLGVRPEANFYFL